MRLTLLLALLLTCPWLAHAGDYACGDGTPATGGGTNFRTYLANKDPVQVTNELDCHPVAKADTALQREFLQSARPGETVPRYPGDIRKLRVLIQPDGVSGKVDDQEPAVIAAINADDAAKQAAADAETAKLQDAAADPFCQQQAIDDIKAAIANARQTASTGIESARTSAHAGIAGITTFNLQNMKAMGDQLVDRIYDGLALTNDRVYDGFDKLASCVFSKAKLQ